MPDAGSKEKQWTHSEKRKNPLIIINTWRHLCHYLWFSCYGSGHKWTGKHKFPFNEKAQRLSGMPLYSRCFHQTHETPEKRIYLDHLAERIVCIFWWNPVENKAFRNEMDVDRLRMWTMMFQAYSNEHIRFQCFAKGSRNLDSPVRLAIRWGSPLGNLCTWKWEKGKNWW